jgi:hypothetical protein
VRWGSFAPAVLLAAVLLACQGTAAGTPTASRSAALASAEAGALGGASQCKTDADCVLERRPAGDCCESLCEPRVVSRAEQAALEARCQGQVARCAMPSCAPQRSISVPVCSGGRCSVRQESNQ